MNKKLDKIFQNSKRILIDENTKIVIMSDCHRGAGDNVDNFVKNQNIYKAALNYYYINGFTYIELGDGDEMWEVKDYKDIIEVHLDSFKQLKQFHDSNRLIMIYGNHDIEKKSQAILEKYFYKYNNFVIKKDEKLLDGLIVYESLVLNYKGYDIFLIHGHQVDFLNGTLWRLSRFLVRYVWRTLEAIGAKAPTGAAKNYKVSSKVEKALEEWSDQNNTILIAGHTHRPMFPKVGQSLYFNDGSCIHPDGITCLEIENGNIILIQWGYNVNKDEVVSVKRKVLSKNESIIKFFK